MGESVFRMPVWRRSPSTVDPEREYSQPGETTPVPISVTVNDMTQHRRRDLEGSQYYSQNRGDDEETKVDPKTGMRESNQWKMDDVFEEWQGGSESVTLLQA